MGEVGVNSADSPSAHIKENGDMNGINNGNNEDDTDDVTVISKKLHDEINDGMNRDESPKIVNDDDDDNADERMETDDEHVNGGREEKISLPDSTDDDSQKPIEQMEVDDESAAPSQNGHHQSEDEDEDSSDSDPDKPVSINSDSDNEEESKKGGTSIDITPQNTNDVSNSSKTNGAKNDDDIQEILSDKEDDCVVVEDDDDNDNDKKPEETISPRRSGRARKSVVSVRDFASFDDDDDIEEIVDDPLSVSGKKRPGLQISTAIRGQTTITPTKSLANNNNSTTSGNTNNKEPTLVIIDTNTLISNARSNNTTINLTTSPPKNPNPFSVVPVGISATSMFNQQPKVAPKPGPPPPLQSVQTLLPALTDDMFVLEAPSFIVPYIYEKPPEENLKEIVSVLEKQVAEIKAKMEKELLERKERGEIVDVKEEDETSRTSSMAEKKESEDKPDTPPVVEEKSKSEKRRRKKRTGDDDYDWDEYNTSTDEEASDGEERTKVLIKEVKEDIDTIKEHIITPETAKLATQPVVDTTKKSDSYFDNPLGKFFMNIGINLVQEFVQTDLLRQQKRKKDREGAHTASVQVAINSLKKNLEVSKENNKPFKFDMKRCEYCPFKTESSLAMANHYETPHLRNYIYKCNFCEYETRPPHEILYHMEAVHNVKGKLDKSLSYHQCPNCPFEDNGKSKLARHQVSCVKKFKPEVNLCPPLDWEPPAKIPRIKPKHGLVGTATAYQAMAAQQQRNVFNQGKPTQSSPLSIAAVQAAALRARGRPQTVTQSGLGGTILRGQGAPNAATAAALAAAGGMMLPKNYQQLAASAMAAVQGNKFLQVGSSGRSMLANTNTSVTIQNSPGLKQNKPAQQPSISITPLPRQSAQSSSGLSVASALSKIQGQGTTVKPGQNPNASGKTSFVVCEICDGYIKDLDQLRNHMQWIHKVKIHPKMIYNRPPLNCQKCQYRFFTDQGLERHLLGSHGLVTSSMQEAANKGKDAGRCPVCGRVYQWKLLNHVSRDHNMTLKPAHLSYKCTVCTATFGMYKQFESHVYSAHSTVAKKALDNKNKQASGSNKTGGDSLLKPLKINDEITIIPQPASKTKTIEIE